ncbi:MAG: HNH endonuclease, partial [Thioalkalispiraceae bacterium]
DPGALSKINDPARKPTLSADGNKVVPLGKIEADAVNIQMPKGAEKGKAFTKNGHTINYDDDGFPVFDSKFDTVLDDTQLNSKKPGEHFKEANKALREELKKNPDLAKELGLTDKQTAWFMKDPAVQKPPKGLTWHHHQDTGRMQLVDEKIHSTFKPHTGGMSIWGGGYK